MTQSFFLVDLTYICSLEQVDFHKAAHIKFLDFFYAQGNFIFSGPKSPRTGGLILAKTNSKTELENILELDPFKKQKIAQYTVTEFTPAMYSEGFKNIIDNFE
jgi:uncharacterized protein YciI